VKVEDEPRFATSAFGSVWVSNYLGSSVSRIDPSSGKVTATIDVDLGGQVMAELDGSLWISSIDYNTLTRIDPKTEKVEKVFNDVGDYRTGCWRARVRCGSPPTWVGAAALRPATGEVTGTWIIGEQGTINANQLLAEADGSFWLPLLESSEVARVAIPD
jgi:streptogramin lyase